MFGSLRNIHALYLPIQASMVTKVITSPWRQKLKPNAGPAILPALVSKQTREKGHMTHAAPLGAYSQLAETTRRVELHECRANWCDH